MKTDVVCVGQSCVDVLVRGLNLSKPFENELTEAESLNLAAGGDCVNQSIVMARLGLKSKLVCGVGRDQAGIFLSNVVASSGADVASLIYPEGYPTAITMVVVSPDGQRSFISTLTKNRITFEPDLEAFRDTKVVSLASLMLPPFTTAHSVRRIIDVAKSQGSLVCADVMAHKELCSFEDFYSVLPDIDYIFPNDGEARTITGKEDLDEMADTLLGLGIKNVIIKIGKRGCFFKNKETRLIVPTFDSPVVDTTGAGDNFASGFIVALLEGRPIKECCTFANAVASIAVQSIGANTGVTDRAQVEDFIKKTEPLYIETPSF
ncbi:sugar kinase [Synergistales bacterium]|nr:sugar kinase [Synergistales bacterium]